MSSRGHTLNASNRYSSYHPQNFNGYKATIAEAADFPAVYDFYARDGRPDAVLLRDKDLVQRRVKEGNFVIIRNTKITEWENEESRTVNSDPKGKIIAASTTYPLADGKRFNCIINEGGSVEEARRVLEVGSVLRRGDGPNENGARPKWLWHGQLFGLPMINSFLRAREMDQPFDTLVCNVHLGNNSTTSRLLGEESVRKYTPFRWMLAHPTPELESNMKATTKDPNAEIPTQFFWASVNGLPLVAQYFVSAAQELGGRDSKPNWERCIIKNHLKDRLEIDLSELPIEMLNFMDMLAFRRDTFSKFPPNISWAAARDSMNGELRTHSIYAPTNSAVGTSDTRRMDGNGSNPLRPPPANGNEQPIVYAAAAIPVAKIA